MDIAYLRPMPGVVLMAPADAAEMRAALELGLSLKGPAAIRYPRDEVPEGLPGPCLAFEPGKARIVREGDGGVFLCYGVTTEPALSAAEILHREHGMSVSVVNARFAKPLDTALIGGLIESGQPMVICEDHALAGGFGSAVLEFAAGRGLGVANVRCVGLPDQFIAHASRQEQLVEVGLGPTHLAAAMKELLVHPTPRQQMGL